MSADLAQPDYAHNMRLADTNGPVYSTDYNAGLFILEYGG